MSSCPLKELRDLPAEATSSPGRPDNEDVMTKEKKKTSCSVKVSLLFYYLYGLELPINAMQREAVFHWTGGRPEGQEL